ncbi:MAG: hypothetical protein PWR01_2852 [Clostridiales bacterium]|nr:hypothetical protein [Clostridiales bacterium]MDN5281779.1 hypothetical protein [Candidatus Ozemobacter sp.]
MNLTSGAKDPFKEFYSHRWALNYGDTDKKETPEFWNERAADFAAKAHSESARRESEQFLSRFSWSADETVLDVAAGPGTFAIPLARRVASITATDFSAEMLNELSRIAELEKLDNILTIQGRWLEIAQPALHDTVLCLNSLGVISTDAHHKSRLEDCLKKLAASCRKRLIMLIPHADSPLEPDLRKEMGLDEISMERRRVAILYYAMVDCGMLPSLHIIRRPFRWTFKDEAEAVETLLLKGGVEKNPETEAIMADYLKTRLKKEDNDRFSLAYDVSQALYVWNRLTDWQ